MGTLYQRSEGGTFYGYWTDAKGKHRRQSLRTRDRVVAKERLRQLELVSTDRATFARHPLHAAIKDLLDVVATGNASATWRSYRQKAEKLVDVLGDVDCSDITRATVLSYVQARKLAGVSDSTIHKELVVLRRALTEAREREKWKGEPRSVVPAIRVRYEPRTRWLTPEQLAELLAEVQVDRRLWVALAGLAGGSLSEVESVEVQHVDLEQHRIRLPGRKRSTRWRLVPIHPSLLPMLRAAVKDRPAGERLVERWPNVRRDLHAAVDRINARNELAARRKKTAQLPRVSPNDLRRTFASWLKQEGVDSLTVAHLMGHSSTRMVELVYGRLSDETYQKAVATMPKLPSVQRVRKTRRHSGRPVRRSA